MRLVADEDSLRISWGPGSTLVLFWGASLIVMGSVMALTFAAPLASTFFYLIVGIVTVWWAIPGQSESITDVCVWDEETALVTITDARGKSFDALLSQPVLRIIKGHVTWASGHDLERIE